jgi:hypothetical protein
MARNNETIVKEINVASNPGSGAKTVVKSHDMDVKLGEGLEVGAIHVAHVKSDVRDAKIAEGVIERCLDLQVNGDPKNAPKGTRGKRTYGNIRKPDCENGCPCDKE